MKSETKLEEIFRLSETQKKSLDRLGIKHFEDLLYYFPSRYETRGEGKSINELATGESVTVTGRVVSTKISKAFRKKIPMAEMVVTDETGKVKAVWFHQPYVVKKFKRGDLVQLSGHVAERKGALYLANPEISEATEVGKGLFNKQLGGLTPIYPETRGLSSLWFYFHIQKILKTLPLGEGTGGVVLEDPIPTEILQKYHLPSIKTALIWIHTPKKVEQAQAARKRFAFEEIFYIQLGRQRARQEYQSNPSYQIDEKATQAAQKFVESLDFKLTGAQERAGEVILRDLASPKPMVRLLEGEVGSGKTAVAAISAAVVVAAGYAVAYMAPTEILARQHFESFISNFKHLQVQVGLITGTECRKFPSKVEPSGHTHISRAQFLKWVKEGIIPIVIGTHALIQKTVQFKNLGLVVIDEQHRFGVRQRAKLTRKHQRVPHLLSMTATPIPRTLALTIYGDLDLTLLDEMPAGRKSVITELVTPDKRAQVYEEIRKRLKEGRQLYVICPRIDEPDPTKALAVQAKSVKEEAKRLKKEVFSEFEIGILHSKLKPADKEKIMRDFEVGKINILCATSVVEVGINVPRATMIIIEGAERFGLAQLHQLRGRVLRSPTQAYCYVFSDSKSDKTLPRLKAIKTAKNGFELAELDLELRGAGELSGAKQWGISDLGMEAIRNIKMVEAARAEAQALLRADFDLKNYPLLQQKVSLKTPDLHFE